MELMIRRRIFRYTCGEGGAEWSIITSSLRSTFGFLRGLPILLVLCASFVSSGCGERHQAEATRESSAALTYWPAPNAQEMQLADTLVRIWNSLHPDIQVKMQAIPVSQSTEEVLLAAIAGKTTPDICSNIWPGALHDYTQAGGLVALDRFPDFDSAVQARTPRDQLDSFRSSDGHFYQLPWKTNPVMMYYNKRILESAGVTNAPRTYSEYFAAGEKIAREAASRKGFDVWLGERDIRPIWWQRLFDFYPFYIAASNGGTLFAGDSVAFNNEAAVKVFAFFRECYSRRYYPRTFFQGGDPFLLEKKATNFAGPWEIAHIHKFVPQLQFGVAPLPVPDDHEGPVYTNGDFKNIAIFSNTRRPREAWEFVKYLITAESDLRLLSICDQIPVRGDLLTNPMFKEYFDKSPLMVKFAEQAPFTRGVDDAPDLKEIFDAISQAYESCAVYGRVSPEEAVQNAARRTRAIVEWNQ